MFKNLRELIASMPDEKQCREYLAAQRWPDGKVVCPYCGCEKIYRIQERDRYKCAGKECSKKFSVTVGTVFEDSKIPLVKWLTAVYLATAHKKGISSYQLSRDIGVSQKCAWFMLHRIREGIREKAPQMLSGMVELDETFCGGKVGNMSKSKRMKMKGRSEGITSKFPVFGMLERDGKVILVQVPFATGEVLKPIIRHHLTPGSTMLTDGFGGYRYMNEFKHEAVSHDKDEYVRGEFHTNSIEGFFSQLKRGIYGIYHHVTPKHLQRYCDEFAYRYNHRKMKDADRFTLACRNLEGRLTYNQLVYGQETKPEKTNSKKEGQI